MPSSSSPKRCSLVDHLVLRGRTDMGVILGELPNAHDAVCRRAMRLVTMAAAKLGQADRKLLVAGDALLEDQHMGRAVHRLQRPIRSESPDSTGAIILG
jgi:hypothetical protein